jgi:hypothetical protein
VPVNLRESCWLEAKTPLMVVHNGGKIIQDKNKKKLLRNVLTGGNSGRDGAGFGGGPIASEVCRRATSFDDV